MLRKSSSSGGAIQRTQGLPRNLSNPNTGSLSAGSTKTWDMGRSTKNHNLLNSIVLEPYKLGAAGVDPDYVMQLVNDVRIFADVLHSLKESFQCKENQDCMQQMVQERLAELLRVLKAVIGKHQTLNSVDILGAAGTVIAKVKGVNFKEVKPENKKAIFGEIYASIDTLAFTFGNVVSDFLMGDVDSVSGSGVSKTRRSSSFDNLSVDPEGYGAEKPDLGEVALSREEEVDQILLKHDSGVESALFYAKAWSKYIKDIMGWMEKHLAMDIECAKNYAKIAETAKTMASQQDYMPFSEIYISTFKNDIENSQVVIQTAVALQTNKFIQPLLARKTELDKMRKDIKEQWQREQKKMHDADASVRKAQALQCQRREEYQKAHSSASRSQEEQANGGNKQLERKRRLEEEALLKAEEAQDQCRSCVADAGLRKMDLANVKSTALSQLRELIFQCDLTLKAVTVNWFQMQQAQTVSLPAHQQALGQSAKLYEPGQRYSEFVRRLPGDPPKERAHSDSISSDNASEGDNESMSEGEEERKTRKMSVGSSHSSHGNLSQVSGEVLSGDEVDSPGQSQPGKMEELMSSSSTYLAGQAPLRAWASGSQGSQGGMCSDSESAGGSSESRSMDSPTASPGTDFRVDSDCDSDTGAGDFKRRLPRTPSTGTMSSADDLDDRELHSPSDNGLGEMVTETASSPGPFRNAQMSKAAHTHKLRKLRAPSKCRECDSLVVFHGAECEECSLACHKKCLETLAIQCGHKKLQGRLHLFGIDFAQAAKNSPDGIPFIIKKCTSEIESRALNIKGIYRVNGAKSRVEKLCQAFENGKDLVELSDLSPHDISNVLKLYLRQLPEPLILYRHYNDVIGLAKEGQRALVEEADASRSGQAAEKAGPGVQLTRVLLKTQDLLCKLPTAHYRTLRFLVAHLHRVMEQAEENKMTASNLGIIFGPTLVKPRQATDAEVSLSSLVDYPYQALMVELLVRHFHLLFPREQCSTGGRGSPRLARLEKEQRLSRHSTSLLDIKESAKINKRHSSVLSSSHMLDKELHSGAAPDRLNGVQTTVAGDVQRSTPAFIRPGAIHASAPKVKLRNQRSRLASRPISMPLERLPAPVQVNERNHRNASTNASSDTIEEADESEKPRAAAAASRVSTYYITPFIDTQHMQRRTWDRKYKHYDVTPRTAMIVANLPPASAGVQPPKASAPSSPATPSAGGAGAVSHANFSAMPLRPVWPPKSDGDTEKRPAAAGGLPMTLRAPRTLQPPPGTFYKPPVSAGSKGRTLTNTPTATTNSPPLSPATATQVVATPPEPSRPQQPSIHKQDSVDSTADSEASSAPATLSPPLSPTPSSPDDLRGCGEAKPVYQRQRPRRQQVLEQREAHFV